MRGMRCSTIQYNIHVRVGLQLIFDIGLLPFKHTKLRSAHTCTCAVVHASAAQLQLYCREIVCEELAQGPNAVTV